MGNSWSQLYPPPPLFTDANLPDQSNKVFLITGGNSGVGFELIKMLYAKNARIYMASRSSSKASAAIQEITSTVTTFSGEIRFLQLDLGDLSTIKASAAAFAAQEEKLDVLWNNAGVGPESPGVKTAQGLELRIGTNCVAPFLFTQLLLPQLRAAAKERPANSVRIVWTSSLLVNQAPEGGVDFEWFQKPPSEVALNYAASKAGNWLLASEFAKRFEGDGIVSVTQNPGNLKTNIWDEVPLLTKVAMYPTLWEGKYGAYTELFAGLSPDVTVEDGVRGRYIMPWGRWDENPREDIVMALKSEEEEGTGKAVAFWKWCEEQSKEYS